MTKNNISVSNVLIASCVALTVVGCGPPDFSPRTWEELDREAIDASLLNPTASVDPANVDAVASETLNDLLNLLEGSTFADALVNIFGGDGQANIRTPGLRVPRINLEGSSVRIEAGCPGVEGVPNWDPEFRFGTLRIDSPALTQDTIENLTLEGHFLAEFKPGGESPVGCQIGTGTFDGFARGYYNAADSRTTLKFEDTITTDVIEGTGNVINDAVVFDPTGTYVLRYTEDDEYWVAVFPNQIIIGVDYILYGVDQTYTCVLLDISGTSDCEPI